LQSIEEHNTEKYISNQNEMQDLMQTPVNNEEDNLIKELRNTSVFTKEKLLDFKTDVITTFEVISMEPRNGLYIEVTSNHEKFEQRVSVRRQRKGDQKIENRSY
jgi:hypothetical protein